MWYLTKKYPILQEILPYPTPGTQTGFGCPVCPYEEDHPLEYTNLYRSNNPNLIGIRCSTFKYATHFFETPYLTDVVEEIQRHNEKAKNLTSNFNLLNSRGKNIPESRLDKDKDSNFVQCKGVNNRYASGHRETGLRRCPNQLCQQCCRQSAARVCSHHRDRAEIIDRSIPMYPLSSPVRSNTTSSNRALVPLPLRRTVKSPTQHVVADKSTIKGLSRDPLPQRSRIQNKKDGKSAKDLRLRVWLKAGEGFSIGAQATDFPRFALIESKPLRDAAIAQLKQKWDTKLEIFKTDSMEWILSDANLSYSYSPSTTTILIKAIGLHRNNCIGLGEEVQNIMSPGPNTTNPPTPTPSSSITVNLFLPTDKPMVVYGNNKRKLNVQQETVSSQTETSLNNKRTWPGTTSKLSDLILWCIKAPKDCPRGLVKSSWLQLFGDRYDPDKYFSTPYKYRTWALKNNGDLIQWMKNKRDPTIEEAVGVFKDSFRQIASLPKGSSTNPVVLE